MLSHAGFHVLEAGDGAEALRVERHWQGPLRLLLTDIIMPHVNGIKLAETLQRERPALRVLFLSGVAEGLLMARHIERSRILLKPVTGEVLLRRVTEILSPQEASDAS